MGIYDNGDDRPAALSEFFNIFFVLHDGITARRIVPMFFDLYGHVL